MSKHSEETYDTYDRYGMDNRDWCRLDEYWATMYGDAYPHENERSRGHQFGMYRKWRPRHYRIVEVTEGRDKRAA